MPKVYHTKGQPTNPANRDIWVKAGTDEIRVRENGGWRMPTGREKEFLNSVDEDDVISDPPEAPPAPPTPATPPTPPTGSTATGQLQNAGSGGVQPGGSQSQPVITEEDAAALAAKRAEKSGEQTPGAPDGNG